jgi:hypothetical protein
VNLGNGTFATGSAVTGFDLPDDARALSLCDWDGDGRMDVWMSARTAPRLRFLRNEGAGGGGWISLRLRGGGPVNRDAIGTRVEVRNGTSTLAQTLRAGEGYLSQSEKMLHFGLGTGGAPVEV